MNRNLIAINENCGAIVDEFGNVRAVSKSNNEYELTEILKKEDEIVINQARLEEARKEYDFNKANIISARIINSIVVGGAVFTGLITLGTGPITVPLLAGGLVYGLGKSFSLTAYGTRKGRKEKKERLEEEIPELEKEDTRLSIELWDMKRHTKFKEESVDVLNNLEIPLNFEQNLKGEKTKVKVLDLRKRR